MRAISCEPLVLEDAGVTIPPWRERCWPRHSSLKRGADGTVKEPTSCNEDLWRTGTDPDCRQFYDKDGNVFYRYYSQTKLSTDQCVALRISRSGQRDDCRNTGGNFTESTGECIYNAYLGESRTCQSTFAGCRAFKGVSAGNVQSVLTENFRTSRGAFY
jgi:hypothetical protein